MQEPRTRDALAHPERVFVLSGPSAVGKNTLAHELCRRGLAVRAVTATTRPPRAGEVDGTDYYFLDREEFRRWIGEGRLVEHTEYVGNYYGTPIASVNRAAEAGLPVLLVIEVDGATQVKERWPAVTRIFVMPPSDEELRRRFAERGADGAAGVERRLQRALEECRCAGQYDFQVVNDRVETAVERLAEIMTGRVRPAEDS